MKAKLLSPNPILKADPLLEKDVWFASDMGAYS